MMPAEFALSPDLVQAYINSEHRAEKILKRAFNKAKDPLKLSRVINTEGEYPLTVKVWNNNTIDWLRFGNQPHFPLTGEDLANSPAYQKFCEHLNGLGLKLTGAKEAKEIEATSGQEVELANPVVHSSIEHGTYVELWIEPWVTPDTWNENQDSGRNRILDSLSL